jgi:hypothetical protein
LDYSHHPKKQGIGPIGTEQQANLRGMAMHSVLMTTIDGLPLGIASQNIWVREHVTVFVRDSSETLIFTASMRIPADETHAFLTDVADRL